MGLALSLAILRFPPDAPLLLLHLQLLAVQSQRGCEVYRLLSACMSSDDLSAVRATARLMSEGALPELVGFVAAGSVMVVGTIGNMSGKSGNRAEAALRAGALEALIGLFSNSHAPACMPTRDADIIARALILLLTSLPGKSMPRGELLRRCADVVVWALPRETDHTLRRSESTCMVAMLEALAEAGAVPLLLRMAKDELAGAATCSGTVLLGTVLRYVRSPPLHEHVVSEGGADAARNMLKVWDLQLDPSAHPEWATAGIYRPVSCPP